MAPGPGVRRAVPHPAPTQPASAERLEDLDDLESVHRRHVDAVARAVRSVVVDPDSVADVVQETFLRAWRSRETYDPVRAPLRPWLLLVARGAAIDYVRARRARPWHRSLVPPAEMPETEHADPGEQLVLAWMVEEEVRRLPETHRVVIVETHLRARPYAEVAADLGIPVGTVRSRVFNALRMMRRSLESQGVTL
ncbi:sigma-70 family RNA polymerase sigma factor [Nocardioidaceae bacterium]|nr:sigma-70 family RNA polymerase sigma factor [Nocardioidaceae bacterium]